MIHAAITLVFCVFCMMLDLSWPFFFWLPIFYLGREIAQAEYRYIEAHGGIRKECPLWCGFMPEAWTAKGMLDWILPLGTSLGALLLAFLLRP